MVLLPWTVRNTRAADKFILVQTLTGYNFWYDFTFDNKRDSAITSGDINQVYTGGPVLLDNGRPYEPYALKANDDAKYDSQLTRNAVQWIVNNPFKFILKATDNLFSFWYVVETPKKMIIAALFSLILVAFALQYPAVSGHRYPKEYLFLLLLVGTIDVLYAPVLGAFRFSLITHPLLCTMVGPSLFVLARRSWERIKRTERVE
jgi:hypothetical protein